MYVRDQMQTESCIGPRHGFHSNSENWISYVKG